MSPGAPGAARARHGPARAGVLLLGLLALGAASSQVATEWEVRAAFLYNFARYTEWPEEALGAADDPFVIAVLGEDPFGKDLDRTLKDKRLHERPVVVRRAERLAELGRVHVLYVGASERPRLTKLLEELRERPVLCVSDLDDFVRVGGVARFVPVDGRIHFQIDDTTAARRGLRISSHLLKLSRPGDD